MSWPPRGGLLHGASIVGTMKTFVSKMCAGFISETTTKYTFCPQPTSSFLDLGAVCVYSALSWLALAPHGSTRFGRTPHLPCQRLRVAETGPDIEDACVSLCVQFLPQPGLHLAALLFKNAVSCGLLTSILSRLHLAADQQAVVLVGFCSLTPCLFPSFPGELAGAGRKEHGSWNTRSRQRGVRGSGAECTVALTLAQRT